MLVKERENNCHAFNEQIEVIGTSELEAMIRELGKETVEEMHENVASTKAALEMIFLMNI